jgi:SHS2 domain-containing protein
MRSAVLRLPQPFVTVAHTADAGVAVTGATLEETLGRLVLGFSSMCAGGAALEGAEERRLAVPGGAALALIAVDTIRAVHGIYALEHKLPAAVCVEALGVDEGARLVLWLGTIDTAAAPEGMDIKAVTYHAASLEPAGDGFRAQVLFDV